MSEAVRWRLRPDLIWETIHTAEGLMHVVKDPVTTQFFHFDPREFSILKLLDGHRDPAGVIDAVKQSRPDEFFSTESLLRFLAEARRQGLLLLSGGATAIIPQDKRSRTRWSLLSWKIPLFNPAGLITVLRPLVTTLFTRTSLLVWLALVLSAIALIAGRFDDVAARLPSAEAWATPQMALTILAVIFACKVVHELAHALIADRFGVRVQECGVMLFYFVPCFYCDVSDSWLLRSPRRRMLISAAGMIAELGLAAVATWLWWFSHPGPMQSVLFAVMVTCSVNTLLLNGNPLLKFDGYFVLVDVLGFPNLAPRAAAWWTAVWNRIVYGLSRNESFRREDILLAIYGAASFAWRIIVLTGMLWALHAMLDRRGAGVVSASLAIVLAGGLALTAVRSALRPWRDPALRRSVRSTNLAISASVFAALALLALFVPLPRSVEADLVIDPAESTTVFVQRTGVLRSLVPAGSLVKTGDVIALLDDFETTRRLTKLESDREIAKRQLESAHVRRAVEANAGQEIPTLMESLAAIEERLALARRDADDLRILAPRDGVVIPPLNSPRRSTDPRAAALWEGSPFDEANLGCTLKEGTPLAVVAASRDVCAFAFVSQRRVELVRPGQQVRLALDGLSAGTQRGTVDGISPAPIESLPRELAVTHRVPVKPMVESARPLEPMYRVRVRLEDPSWAASIGSLGTARISAEPASLAARTWRLLTETFRVDL
jgi:putative peptide zinc metalloprotease protein